MVTIVERCANMRRCAPGAARGARIAAPARRGDVVAEETATDLFAASGARGARAIAIVLRALETATREWRASETAARCMRRRQLQWDRAGPLLRSARRWINSRELSTAVG